MHGTKAANLIVQECDLLIVVGARFDDRVTGKLDTFAPHAKVIHLDIDAAEFNKLRHAHAPLRGDINVILPQLELSQDIADWVHYSEQLRQQFKWRYDHPGELIYAPLLMKQLSDMMPDSAMVSTDVGQHQMWPLNTSSPARRKTTSPLRVWAPWALACLRPWAPKWHGRMTSPF
ncbi:acetolactate synthase large subunit [Photobacterium aphoticum]|uniref:Acetolactate synthase large subunit n=1 Tax=Photobacterium aphoticum TaxID=754436 RepID=A0A090QY10_9GAMM|nr:acetolactate synthase large subunit [Photobacterium aphoticum]